MLKNTKFSWHPSRSCLSDGLMLTNFGGISHELGITKYYPRQMYFQMVISRRSCVEYLHKINNKWIRMQWRKFTCWFECSHESMTWPTQLICHRRIHGYTQSTIQRVVDMSGRYSHNVLSPVLNYRTLVSATTRWHHDLTLVPSCSEDDHGWHEVMPVLRGRGADLRVRGASDKLPPHQPDQRRTR